VRGGIEGEEKRAEETGDPREKKKEPLFFSLSLRGRVRYEPGGEDSRKDPVGKWNKSSLRCGSWGVEKTSCLRQWVCAVVQYCTWGT